MNRYVKRPDSKGYSVYDLWAGEAVVIAATPQTGLSEDDADHTARLLNSKARVRQAPAPRKPA